MPSWHHMLLYFISNRERMETAMEILKITDPKFREYGRVITEVDYTPFVEALKKKAIPAEGMEYSPSDAELEAIPEARKVTEVTFGELEVEIGYNTGRNHMLNALEYHRSSEVNFAPEDWVAILGKRADITDDFTYDTSKCVAFLIPAGTAVEVYATTLHYAPISLGDGAIRVGVILPRGTNFPLDKVHEGGEDSHLTAKNKWLLGHPEGGLPEGSPMGLVGENYCIK